MIRLKGKFSVKGGDSFDYLCKLPSSDSLIGRQQNHFPILVSCT